MKNFSMFKETLILYVLLFLSIFTIKNNFFINPILTDFKDFIYYIESIPNRMVLIEFKDNLKDDFNNNLINDNEELKEILKLNSTYSMYSLKHALILKKDLVFYNEILIDKGKKDGITIGDAVINREALIGVITDVTNDYSVVKLLFNRFDNSKISVKVNNEDGVIYYSEKYNGMVLDGTKVNTKIKIGDSVYTSSNSFNYLPNIYIGFIEDYVLEDNNKIYKIKVSDLSYNYVSVITK